MRNKNNSSSHSTDQLREESSLTLLVKKSRHLKSMINTLKAVKGEELEEGITINLKRISHNIE